MLLTNWNRYLSESGRRPLAGSLHILLSMALIAGVVAGCNKPKATPEESATIETIPVTVQNPTTTTMRNLIRFTGDVRPDIEVRVTPKVPERIIKLRKEVGDWVEAGAALAEVVSESVGLGVAQTSASLEAAQVNLRSAEDDFARVKALYGEKVASKAQYDGAKTRLDAAAAQVRSLQAALGQSKNTLRDTVITAPVSGIITARHVDEGNMASPAVPIYTVMAIDQVRIKVQVAESEFAKVANGMEVEARVPAYGSKVFHGIIERTSPIIDLQTRMGTIEILIPNEEHLLRPGMFATVNVVAEVREGVLSIPQEALIYDDASVKVGDAFTHYRVFLAGEDNKAVLRPVLVGFREAGRIQILSGVDDQSKVVVKGWQFLRNGTLIQVVDADGPSASASASASVGSGAGAVEAAVNGNGSSQQDGESGHASNGQEEGR